MTRVRFTRDEGAWFPLAGVRLEPGEQDVTEEQYAALAGSVWVERVNAGDGTEPEPEPEPDDVPAEQEQEPAAQEAEAEEG